MVSSSLKVRSSCRLLNPPCMKCMHVCENRKTCPFWIIYRAVPGVEKRVTCFGYGKACQYQRQKWLESSSLAQIAACNPCQLSHTSVTSAEPSRCRRDRAEGFSGTDDDSCPRAPLVLVPLSQMANMLEALHLPTEREMARDLGSRQGT